MTAGIAGYIAPLGDIPDDVWFSERDPIVNNLYGVINIMQQFIQYWDLTTAETKEQIMTRLGFVPTMILTSSIDGFDECPECMLYGASKHAIIGATKSVA